MKQVSVTELKNRLSEYLRLVKSGESIEVVERSIPVARLEPLREEASGSGSLERLLRDGIATRASRKISRGVLRQKPVPCKADVVRALVEERGRD